MDLTSVYGSQTSLNSTATTSHSALLTNLQSNTIYHFKLLSTASGTNAPTSDLTFTTGKASTYTATSTTNCPPGLICKPVSPPSTISTVVKSTPITEFLTIGSSDAQVLALQKFLAQNGFLKPQYETGYYGTLTQSAVKSFQSAHNIPTVGTVGPLTRAAINALSGNSNNSATQSTYIPSTPTPITSTNSIPPAGGFTTTLKLGSTGAEVKQLQVFLNSHGFIVASTGNGSKGHETTYYGPATAAAISRFQLAHYSTILAPYGLHKEQGILGLRR